MEFTPVEVGLEFGVRGVLLLVKDGADSEKVRWVDYWCDDRVGGFGKGGIGS